MTGPSAAKHSEYTDPVTSQSTIPAATGISAARNGIGCLGGAVGEAGSEMGKESMLPVDTL